MLSILSYIADALGLSFQFGDPGQFNVIADHVSSFPIMYVEGYHKGLIATNPFTGKFRLTYNIDMWVLGESTLADEPGDRAVQLETLQGFGLRVLRELGKVAEITGDVNFIEYIDIRQVDRGVDGILYTFSVIPNQQPVVC